MRAAVYDYFVANYAGPLTPAAAAALANRGAYNAWVQRIATWVDGGALIEAGAGPGGVPGAGHVLHVRHVRGAGGHRAELLTVRERSATRNRPLTPGRFRGVRRLRDPAIGRKRSRPP